MPAALPSGEGLGEKFRTYIVLETGWWFSLAAICYRFKPTVLVMQSGWGSHAVRRAGAWLKQVWPARYEGITTAAGRMYTSPNGRTLGEWLLINKVLAPVSFPAKLALANRIVNQRAALAGAVGLSAAATATVGFAATAATATAAPSAEPDLAIPPQEAVQRVLRSVTGQALQPTVVGTTPTATTAPPSADAGAAAPKKPTCRICCACPDTRKVRDECIVMHGEEECAKLIEAHKVCLRAEGFNV